MKLVLLLAVIALLLMVFLPLAFFFIFVLPYILLEEGFKLLHNHVKTKNLWWRIPYYLLYFLIVLFLILLILGYR
jgi:hypothetical protein